MNTLTPDVDTGNEAGNKSEEENLLPEIDTEAKNRLAEILTHLGGRFGGERLVSFVQYELQEITSGHTMPQDTAIFQMDDLKKILYSPDLGKKEIRIIIAGIAHRARKVQESSDAKIRENMKNLQKK